MAKQPRIPPTVPGERGTPISTTLLDGGMRLHTMVDGRMFEEDGPGFRMTYQSAMPGSEYTREIAIFGLNPEDSGLFDGWCYVYNALRTYAFHKVISVTDLGTSVVYSGDDLCKIMKGKMRPH